MRGNMEQTPRPNQIYRHFKGNLYRVLTLAKHTETEETLVIYQALYDNFEIYARPLALFIGEVDHEKYPDVKEKKRFTLVPEIFGQGAGTQTLPEAHTIEERPAVWKRKEGRGGEWETEEGQKGTWKLEDGQTGARQIEEGQTKEEQPRRNGAQPKEISVPESLEADTEEGFNLDPLLLEFLEADSYEEKLNILVGMHSRLTWEMLRSAAVSLDIELEEEDLEDGYQTLKNCLLTLEKYECTRLR